MRPLATLLHRWIASPAAVIAMVAAAMLSADAETVLMVDLPRPSSRAARQLAQVDALVAEQQWTEAIEMLETLLSDPSAGVSVVDAGGGRFFSATENCHAKIAALPEAGRRQYQATIDSTAKDLYERGRAGRDPGLLRRVIDEAYCSTWGDDAARTLGDLALERGDFAAARRWWRLASPLLSDPAGRPLVWALRGVDLDTHGAEVLRRLRETPRQPGTLAHPDSDVPLGELLVRLVAASTRQGDLARARRELAMLRVFAPDSAGRVGGVEGDLATLAAGMIEAAEDQTTDPASGQATDRIGPLNGRLWPAPRPLERTRSGWQSVSPFGGVGADQPFATPTLPLVQPTVWGRCVLYRTGGALLAADLLDGAPRITRRGELHRAAEQLEPPAGRAGVIRFGFPGPRVIRQRGDKLFGEPATVHQGAAYARVGPAATANSARRGKPRLVGRDLRRAGLATLDIDSPGGDWSFGGPPVANGGRLYISLVADEVRPRLGVACYSVATGGELWRTEVLRGQPGGETVSKANAYPLLLAGGVVVLATDFGATAAIDAVTGALRWFATEPRGPAPLGYGPRANTFAAIAAGDRLYTASTATATVQALDLATGLALWRTKAPCDEATPLGASDGVLVIAGTQVAGLDTETGRRLYCFPGSEKSGLRGRGRGCVAGAEVFWPTRDWLFAFDTKTGEMTRPPIDLADLGGDGATVTPALGCLVVAGANAMTVLGPIDRQSTNKDSFTGPTLSD